MTNKKWTIFQCVILACLLASVNSSRAGDFENKIVSSAAGKVGQKAGDGNTTRLVEQAFAAAGAKPGRNLQWGTVISSGALNPGDVIQFKYDYDKKTGKSSPCVFKNGGNTWDLTGFAGVVEKAKGTKVTILYQNGKGIGASDSASVQRLDLDLRWRTSGTYDFYRPVNNPQWAALGSKIVNFAASRIDQKGVGDGGCSRLVDQAFAAAGAKPGDNLKWGTVVSNGALYPGDIIQFKNAVFKNGGYTWNLGAPDHTAIVEKAQGTKVTLLHQNVDGEPTSEKSKIRRLELDLKWRKSGDYTFYQPVPK